MEVVATDQAFRPPAPTPRVLRPGARPTPLSYYRYFRIMARNPLEIWTTDHFTKPVVPGQVFGVNYFLVQDPAMVRQFMVTNSSNYGLTYIRKALFEPVLGNGLLVAEGESWKRTRHALTPAFTARHVQGFAKTMETVAAERASALAARKGDTVSLSREMLTLTLDILIACLFSGDTRLDVKRFSENLDRLLVLAGSPHPLDLMEAPDWVPRFGRGEALSVVAELRAQVTDVLTARRALLSKGDDAPDDFLTLLIKAEKAEGEPLTDDDIIDNLLTFLSAGHETTARSLTWAFYLLSKSPADAKKVAEEIGSASLEETPPEDWGDALPFTQAVLKESMRLYPAAPILARLALGDDKLGDLDVKKGTQIIASPWILHRHEQLWKDPNAFDPTRFLGEREKEIQRFSYVPFGMGPRVCIGASFSMQEMMIVLASFLKKLRFDHVGKEEPQPIMRITIQPSTPVNMQVSSL